MTCSLPRILKSSGCRPRWYSRRVRPPERRCLVRLLLLMASMLFLEEVSPLQLEGTARGQNLAAPYPLNIGAYRPQDDGSDGPKPAGRTGHPLPIYRLLPTATRPCERRN